jgi:hypothetical protein
MPDRIFPDLETLIQKIEATAADSLDPLAIMIELMKLAVASSADPYLLAGALIEGITSTIAARIPQEKRRDVALEAVRLLRDRLETRGLI